MKICNIFRTTSSSTAMSHYIFAIQNESLEIQSKFKEKFTTRNKWKSIENMSTIVFNMFVEIWYENDRFVNSS